MTQQESKKKLQTAYEAFPVEIQAAIMEWVKATEQFHRRYAKITNTINSLQSAGRHRHSIPIASRLRLRQLITLRQRMSDTLMTLILEMSGQEVGISLQLSKPDQFQSHARVLSVLLGEVEAELTSAKSIAQATTANLDDTVRVLRNDVDIAYDSDVENFNHYVISVIETCLGNSLNDILHSSLYDEYGKYIFKDFSNYEKWLMQPNPDFGGSSPFDYTIDTQDLSKVKDFLGRLAHGIYF